MVRCSGGPAIRVGQWGSGEIDTWGGGEGENSGVASGEPQQQGKCVRGGTVVLPDSRPAPEVHPVGPQMLVLAAQGPLAAPQQPV